MPSGKLWMPMAGEQDAGPFDLGGGEFSIAVAVDVFRSARFVRVFVFRHQVVDQRRHGDSSEKGGDRDPGTCGVAFELDQAVLGLSQQFHQGNVHHHAAGEAQGEGERLRVRLFHEEGDKTSYAGGKPC